MATDGKQGFLEGAPDSNSVGHSGSWQATSISAGQDIPRHLRNSKALSRVSNPPLPNPIQIQSKSVVSFPSSFLKTLIIILCHLHLDLRSSLFLSGTFHAVHVYTRTVTLTFLGLDVLLMYVLWTWFLHPPVTSCVSRSNIPLNTNFLHPPIYILLLLAS
jgi:hypothetical protein